MVKSFNLDVKETIKGLESVGNRMTNGFFQKVDLSGRISNMPASSMPSMPSLGVKSIDETQGSSFKGVMSNLTQSLNQDMNAPDQLLKDSMTGNSDVDIHDVMTAMAKAEISVSVATQVTSKVIQAYDKIMQISV